MKRFLIIMGVVGIMLVITAWQLPNIIRAIPSRYVVAYFPESLQTLGEREHVDQLPTASAPVDVSVLLPTATIAAPATQTAVPTITTTPEPDATAVPSPPPAPPTATPIPFPQTARLNNIVHQFQGWNNCGPATLAMALSYFGVHHLQYDTALFLKPDPEDRNVTPWEMAAYVNQETNLQATYRVNGNLDLLRGLISQGMPVIVETGIDPPGEYSWLDWYGHYFLVVAYDENSVWVYDSWFGSDPTLPVEERVGGGNGRAIDYETFAAYWQQFNYTYIALYTPEQRPTFETIVGEQLDDQTMWSQSLTRTQAELEQAPEKGHLWFNLGNAYNALGEYELAAVAFDKAREVGLPWRMLWYQFGPYEAYYQIGRYQDVIELADVTLNQRPYFEESYYYRGLAYQALGNEREAQADLERAVDFNPNFQPAVDALAALSP